MTATYRTARGKDRPVGAGIAMATLSVERRLAAILAADVVGYSRLMGEDESGTHARLKEHRKELIDPAIAAHHGHMVKLTGDGALVEFGSVVDAVACAVEIQRNMALRNADVPESLRIQFRVGINLGDVIVDADDIYGDGVNVAARLEALAEPGGICVSDLVHRSVEAKIDVAFQDLGEQTLKNIAKPVRVYRVGIEPGAASVATKVLKPSRRRWLAVLPVGLVLVVAIGTLGWHFYLQPLLQERAFAEQTALPLPDKPSIAVLPFANMSGDPTQDYFSDGMTDSLITDLSQVSGLFVIARNSVVAYQDRPANAQEVGRELGVRYVLEGSVQRAAGRVRINAQLIDAATGYHLWAERFDRELEDVFALQDHVAERIVSALEVELTESERGSLVRRYTQSIEAYDHYLRGWDLASDESEEALLRSRAMFEKAIELDPDFAPAYAQLGYAMARDISGVTGERDADLARASELAEKALELDDTLPLVHFALAYVARQRQRPAEAIASLEKALALDPNYADAYAFLGCVLSFAGRPDEGLEMVEKAKRLDPAASVGYSQADAFAYFALARYEDAINVLTRSLGRNPTSVLSRIFLAASYANANRLADAEWEVAELLTLDPGLSIASVREWVPFTAPEPLGRMVSGLRKAGLPE
jgi:adenylate cyclase